MAGKTTNTGMRRAVALTLFCVGMLTAADDSRAQPIAIPEPYLLAQSGWSSLGAQKYEIALNNFDRALAADPGYLPARAGRARALAGLGQVNAALAITSKFRNLGPKYMLEDAAILLIAERPDTALARIDAAAAELLRSGNENAVRNANRDFFRRAFYLRGEALYLLGGYDRAGADFEKARDLNGGASALRGIGDSYFAMRDFPAAEKAYSAALKLRKHDGAAYHRRGRVRYLQGELEEALADFKEAEVYLDNSVEFLSQYAEALMAARNYSEAVTVLTRLLKVSGDNTNYQRTVKYHLAVALIDADRPRDAEARLAELESWSEIDVERQFQLGRARFAGQDYNSAVRYFGRALEMRKGDPQILYNRGLAWLRLGQVEKALNDLSQAALIAPTDAKIRDAIGRLRLSRGDSEEAIAFFDAAVKAHPNDPESLIQRSNAFLATGQPDKALSDATDALKMRPNDLQATAAAARALQALDRAYESLPYVETLVESNSMKKEGYFLSARAAIAQQQPDKALSLIEQARNHGASSARLAVLSGDAYALQNNYRDAVTQYEQAVALTNNAPYVIVKRGDANFELGNNAEAVRDYTDALLSYPNAYTLHLKRGQAFKRLGNCEAAIKDFDYALKLVPDDNDAMGARGRCMLSSGKFIGGFSDLFRSLI